jgi:hypothetical protein
MPESDPVKRIHIWKPFTGRPAGRPKCRWEGDLRNDLKEMKVMKWQNKYRTALNGRILWRRPRMYQSCSDIEEEEEEEEGRRGGRGEERGGRGGEVEEEEGERVGGGQREEKRKKKKKKKDVVVPYSRSPLYQYKSIKVNKTLTL